MAPWTLQGGSAALLVARACIAWGLDNNLTSVIDGVTPAQTTLLKGQAAGSLNVLLGVLLEPNIASGREVLGALGVGAIGYGLSLVCTSPARSSSAQRDRTRTSPWSTPTRTGPMCTTATNTGQSPPRRRKRR